MNYTKAQVMRLFLILGVLISLLTGCWSSQSADEQKPERKVKIKERPVALDNGKFFDKNGFRYLYGGEHESQHFDITNYDLKDGQFHYGIGREQFPALLQPKFINMAIADSIYADSARFLVLHKDNITKAYAIKDLTRHEVVNDEINGQPIMAAYCILADLGAIYDRTLNGRTYTFALSGYTYYDDKVWDGMDGFVLWDRETESLWWPLIGKAVSGPMQGAAMEVMDEQYWQQTTWQKIKYEFSDVLVLKPGQDFERPVSWPKYIDNEIDSLNTRSIAPKWGENTN
jgi:hypothetical protein